MMRLFHQCVMRCATSSSGLTCAMPRIPLLSMALSHGQMFAKVIFAGGYA